MISVAIIGGSGYTGKYIVKFINDHINVIDFSIYANKSAGKTLHDVFPDLLGEVDNQTILSINDLKSSHDVYFFALPHGESFKYIPSLIQIDKKVIDLGADYRLDSAEQFSKVYNLEHSSPDLLQSKIYGLAEIQLDYSSYNLIANPGCYPTAALLSAIPVVKNFSPQIQNITTVAYSGLSGAGKKASQDLLFAENYNSVKAYNVGTHRHETEISQELNKFGAKINYSLTTHLLPVFSGIYATTIIHLIEDISQSEIDSVFLDQYKNSTFVRLRNTPPELKWVVGSNYCDINVKSRDNKIIVTTAIDNLIKGASGQAVQNMNKLFGWEEFLGIKSYKEEFQNV
jgi:N-acetyl-gamma-glutamyl-phosphate reductase